MNPDELGELAYVAYRATMGTVLPRWADVPPEQRLAWANAGEAVWVRIMGTGLALESKFRAREKPQECRHCNFIWPPGKHYTRCPGCHELFDG